MKEKNSNKVDKVSIKNNLGSSINKVIGSVGESAAIVYLKHKGHELLGRNIRLKRGEIDILTKKDTTLHVVEVKTALLKLSAETPIGAQVGLDPEESFSASKLRRLKHLANVIMARHPECRAVQIDGIAIRISPGKVSGKVADHRNFEKITARYYPCIA